MCKSTVDTSTMQCQCDKGKPPVDSLVKPILVAAKEWLAEPEPDNGTVGELPVDEITAMIAGLVDELERLEVDRQWQIKQNVHMFKSLEKMAEILPMGHTTRERECFDLVQAAMVESVKNRRS